MVLAKFPLDVRHSKPVQNRDTVLDLIFARRHRDYARLRAAGRAPTPEKEGLSRQNLRRAAVWPCGPQFRRRRKAVRRWPW
jgi:hypothetical protein